MGTRAVGRMTADDHDYVKSGVPDEAALGVQNFFPYVAPLKVIDSTGADVTPNEHEDERLTNTRPSFLRRLAVKVGSKIILVPIHDILWIQSMGNLVRIQLQDTRYDCRMTMANLQKRLDPAYFVRVHRCAIVNLDHVVEFDLPDDGNAFVHMVNGKSVPISKAGRSALRTTLLTEAYVL